ncbi:MAG: alpha/beta hydrolase-fold protein [Microlunatus sp.]
MQPSRRAFLATGAAGLAAATMISVTPATAEAAPVRASRPAPTKGSRLLAHITPVGTRITAVCIDVGIAVLGCRDLARCFSLTVRVGDADPTPLTIARAYTRSSASTGEATGGRYVVFELAGLDETLPQPYRFIAGNTEPMLFREYAADGTIVQRQRVQATQTPEPFGASLVVAVERTAAVVRADGGLVDESRWEVDAAAESLTELDLHDFTKGVIAADGSDKNVLHYRLRRPAQRHSRAPLVLFLHGSGQVGTDNLAQVLSSRGATGVLGHEDAYVVAPQAPAVFDAYDSYDEATGTGGGIHWQTRNRRRLLAALVRDVIRRNSGVDRDRVYVVGLSRGAEGALALLLDEPDLFAGAVLASGREAGTVEWLSGHATRARLRPALRTPLWFFHATQDTVSPVDGSRINVEILRDLGHRDLRYTEVSYESPGDSGYLNTSAHNSWDLAFNSPEVWEWLLGKRRRS